MRILFYIDYAKLVSSIYELKEGIQDEKKMEKRIKEIVWIKTNQKIKRNFLHQILSST